MLRLLLMRHAKSDWSDTTLHDFDRPLNARGRQAAEIMAELLVEAFPPPDLILCSSALRTRQTLSRILERLAIDTDIQLREDLYEESDSSYLPILQSIPNSVETVLLIGHNPAVEDTAYRLFGDGDASAFQDLETKYPTAAIAEFTFAQTRWSDVSPATGTLTRFVKPRDLVADMPE